MRRPAPFFWWDIEGDNVIVECNDPQYPVIASFECDPPEKQKTPFGVMTIRPAMKAIELAEALIADLDAGRIDYRRKAKEEVR